MIAAAADGSPVFHRSLEAAKQQGAPSAGSVNPNSRKGRLRPHLQGRDMDQIFIGIDVSKDRLDVHVRPTGLVFASTRDGVGLEQLVLRVQGLAPSLVVIEATGGFETTVAAALASAGLPLAVVNPRQIRDFARATGRLAKTDALDAAVIAHFAEAVHPQPRPVPDEQARALGELVARRRQLIEMTVAERNRRPHLASKRLVKGVDRVLAILQKELSTLEAELDDTIRATPAWRANEDLLTSVPGVGQGTARTLLAELPELGTLERKPLAALAGLAPFAKDSGRRHRQRSIAGGRKPVRAALYMAALAAIRCNPVIAAFYKRLRAVGKPGKLALTACMRKLLIILNAILRDKKPWQHP
jgi:transposase